MMPSEDSKALEFKQYQKFDKASFIIYADLQCLIEKTDWCKNNPENSFTKKAGEQHIPSVFSMSTIFSFKNIEKKHDVFREKKCMKKFCESLWDHAMKIINYKKEKKWTLLTKEHQQSYENGKICYSCKEKFENRYVNDKKYCKVRDCCHYTGKYGGAAHNICNLKNTVPKTIFIAFHIGPYYHYHFIIKELEKSFQNKWLQWDSNPQPLSL